MGGEERCVQGFGGETWEKEFTLEQATKGQRGVEVSLYSFFNLGARWGVGGQRHAPAALPTEGPGSHCIGGWVGLRAGLDENGKYRPPPGFDPRTVHLVARRYTNYAIPAHSTKYHVFKYGI